VVYGIVIIWSICSIIICVFWAFSATKMHLRFAVPSPRTPPLLSAFGLEFQPFRPQDCPFQDKFLATLMKWVSWNDTWIVWRLIATNVVQFLFLDSILDVQPIVDTWGLWVIAPQCPPGYAYDSFVQLNTFSWKIWHFQSQELISCLTILQCSWTH